MEWSGEEHRPWSPIERVLVLALPSASSVFVGKLFSKSHSSLEDCDNHFFVRFNPAFHDCCGELNEIVCNEFIRLLCNRGRA